MDLKAYFATMIPAAPLFPLMPEKDLEAAGIKYETDSGVMGFHARRGTCLSWIANDAGKCYKTRAKHPSEEWPSG